MKATSRSRRSTSSELRPSDPERQRAPKAGSGARENATRRTVRPSFPKAGRLQITFAVIAPGCRAKCMRLSDLVRFQAPFGAGFFSAPTSSKQKIFRLVGGEHVTPSRDGDCFSLKELTYILIDSSPKYMYFGARSNRHFGVAVCLNEAKRTAARVLTKNGTDVQ